MGLPDALAAVANALDKVPLSELVPKNQQVVSLEHNTTVGQALSILAKKHILSAPLVVFPGLEDSGCTDGEDPQPQLIGWVTVESILKAFLSRKLLSVKRVLAWFWPGLCLPPACCAAAAGRLQPLHDDLTQRSLT